MSDVHASERVPPGWVMDGLNSSQWDRELFEEAIRGGVNCVNATLVVWEDARTTMDIVGRWYRLVAENSDVAMLVRTMADIQTAAETGKLGILLGFQNASPFEDDLLLVETFRELGVRVVQLTYNIQNHLGASCYDPQDAGLTRYGRNVLREMNRVGMLVDLSHVGERTSLDTITASEKPVAITHANPSSFSAHPRNKSDAVLRELAAAGGVLGCTPYTHLIGGHDVPRKSFVEMLARTAELMGVDHVAIGSDLTRKRPDNRLKWSREGRWTFTPEWGAGSAKEGHRWAPWPQWFGSLLDMPALQVALRDGGFSESDVELLMGGNWYRLLQQTI